MTLFERYQNHGHRGGISHFKKNLLQLCISKCPNKKKSNNNLHFLANERQIIPPPNLAEISAKNSGFFGVLPYRSLLPFTFYSFWHCKETLIGKYLENKTFCSGKREYATFRLNSFCSYIFHDISKKIENSNTVRMKKYCLFVLLF